MKPFHLFMLLFTLAFQMTGCAASQTTSSETASHPTEVVSSVAANPPVQSPAESNHASARPADEQSSLPELTDSTKLPEEKKMNRVTLEAGGKTFSVTLAENEAAKAFAAYLPMTVRMSELNGQEKFYNLPDNLPADTTERPSTIRSGDIMCWSGNTLVLFYTTFQNSYGGYVRLGVVDDSEDLAASLGNGSVEVTWTLTE